MTDAFETLSSGGRVVAEVKPSNGDQCVSAQLPAQMTLDESAHEVVRNGPQNVADGPVLERLARTLAGPHEFFAAMPGRKVVKVGPSTLLSQIAAPRERRTLDGKLEQMSVAEFQVRPSPPVQAVYLSRDPTNQSYFKQQAQAQGIRCESEDYRWPVKNHDADSIAVDFDRLLPDEKTGLRQWVQSNGADRPHIILHSYDDEDPSLEGMRQAGVVVVRRLEEILDHLACKRRAA